MEFQGDDVPHEGKDDSAAGWANQAAFISLPGPEQTNQFNSTEKPE